MERAHGVDRLCRACRGHARARRSLSIIIGAGRLRRLVLASRWFGPRSGLDSIAMAVRVGASSSAEVAVAAGQAAIATSFGLVARDACLGRERMGVRNEAICGRECAYSPSEGACACVLSPSTKLPCRSQSLRAVVVLNRCCHCCCDPGLPVVGLRRARRSARLDWLPTAVRWGQSGHAEGDVAADAVQSSSDSDDGSAVVAASEW